MSFALSGLTPARLPLVRLPLARLFDVAVVVLIFTALS